MKVIPNFTRQEKNALLYYQGGVDAIHLDTTETHLKDFYAYGEAYQIMNALLMPGLKNEMARLVSEDRKFELNILDHMDELIRVYCNIYSAACKYTFYYEKRDQNHTYRVDRMNTLEFLQHGQMYSFMSTSGNTNSHKDFSQGKSEVLLLEIDASADVEHVDINEVLEEESVYPEEEEILYTPFVFLDKEELQVTVEEQKYLDKNGNAPKAKYLLHLRLSSVNPEEIGTDSTEMKGLYAKIVDKVELDNAKVVWKCLMNKQQTVADQERRYLAWKEKLQIYLRMRFSGIKWEIGMPDRRLQMLKDEAGSYMMDTDKKRRWYKRWMKVANICLSVLYPLAALMLALGFVENYETETRCLSLIFTAMATSVWGICKGCALEKKWQQRTIIFLKLDELLRDIRYEKKLDVKTVEDFIIRFKNIMKEDNAMCRENTKAVVEHFQTNGEEEQKK